MVDRIRQAGMRLLLIDMTTDIGVPAFLAIIIPGNSPIASMPAGLRSAAVAAAIPIRCARLFAPSPRPPRAG